jgi:hypothetical protein
MNHTNSLFCFFYSEDGVLLFSQANLDPSSSYFMLSAIAGMTGMCHYAQLFFFFSY